MAGTGPAEGGAEAVAAGCNKAAGPAGSNRSHLAVHTEVASVKKPGKESEKVRKCNSMNSDMVSIQRREVASLPSNRIQYFQCCLPYENRRTAFCSRTIN